MQKKETKTPDKNTRLLKTLTESALRQVRDKNRTDALSAALKATGDHLIARSQKPHEYFPET